MSHKGQKLGDRKYCETMAAIGDPRAAHGAPSCARRALSASATLCRACGVGNESHLHTWPRCVAFVGRPVEWPRRTILRWSAPRYFCRHRCPADTDLFFRRILFTFHCLGPFWAQTVVLTGSKKRGHVTCDYSLLAKRTRLFGSKEQLGTYNIQFNEGSEVANQRGKFPAPRLPFSSQSYNLFIIVQ
jgi:hypothetical protein